MAEIEIVKKKPIWPWILVGIVVLLALLYFLFFTGADDDVADTMDDDIEMTADDVDTTDDEAMMLSGTAASKITDYQTYVAKEADMGLEHDYSRNGLTKLIDATEAVANSLGINVKADMDEARRNADAITTDPLEVNHADKIKNAANIILQAMKKIQRQKFPDLDKSSSELQNSVTAIATGTQTLEQKAAIKNFFEQAGDLLTNMKNR